MNKYIPQYIKQIMDYKKGELLTAADYNNIINLLITASDYNTTVLDKLCNNPEVALIINAAHAEHATEADTAKNSEQLSEAVLSRRVTTTLEDNDNKIPSSRQVKNYVDTVDAALRTIIGNLTTTLNGCISENNTQNSRLANIDMLNNRYGSLITALDARVAANEQAVTNLHQTTIKQNATLAYHDRRLTALEVDELPSGIVETLMTKGSYAYNTGQIDEQGNPIYSEDTVAHSNSTSNLLVNSELIAADAFELKSNTAELKSKSFLTRGDYPASDYYKTVASLQTLALGAYFVSAEVSVGLGLGDNAGTLRLYPCQNGHSLEFEVQTGDNLGAIFTTFAPNSILGTTPISTLPWTNLQGAVQVLNTEITNLNTNKITAEDVKAGTDINVSRSNNEVVINYTGPKIVISAEQPAADPNRQTLWIAL